MITGKNYIGFSLSSINTKTFNGHGGTVRELSGAAFHEASKEEVDEAVSKSSKAFETYRLFDAEKKASFLDAIASAIEAAKDELMPVAMQETRLSQTRLTGEVQRTITQIKLFSQLLREGSWVNAIIDTAQPERKPLPKPDIRQMQIALGPVAVFGASNFPFAFSVAGGDTVSAFAAGCPVVYKSHPGHPATSEITAQLIIKAAKQTEMPDGVFSMLQGEGYQISIQLVTHPSIKAVAFTGSLAGGKALFDAAAKRKEPIPVYAEMGSINPVFVLPELMKQNGHAVADKLAASNTLSAGQFCTNPGLIISLDSMHTNEFLKQFENSVNNCTVESMLTEKIHRGYNQGIEKLSQSKDIDVITSTAVTDKEAAALPYIFKTNADTFLKNEDLLDEVFGPSSIQVVAGEEKQLYAIADRLPGQLTVSVWGTDDDFIKFKPLMQKLELKAGRIICNAVPTGVEVTHAMVHGGPYPATTDSRTTSVGTNAIYRFTRAVCYQGYPSELLPDALKNENPLNIWRKVNGKFTVDMIGNNA